MNVKLKPYLRREDGWAATTTAIVLSITAALTSAAGAITGGLMQKSAADFNAKVADNNAKMAQQQAAAEAQQIEKRNRRLRGSQRAAMAAAGLDSGSDSADTVEYDSSVAGELDRLTTLYKGHVNAVNFQSQASADRMAGSAALTAGFMNAGGSLLSGGARAASLYASSKTNAPTID